MYIMKNICWRHFFDVSWKNILDCISPGNSYTQVLYLFKDHRQKRRNIHVYRVQRNITLQFNKKWQQKPSVFLLAAARETLYFFQCSCPLCSRTPFLLRVIERLAELCLTSRSISIALSTTLQSTDDSAVSHLTQDCQQSICSRFWRSGWPQLQRSPQYCQSYINILFQNASEFQGELKTYF